MSNHKGGADAKVGLYTHMTLLDLLDAFAANEPVPGGGSAAALAGAVGTALLIMVAGLPRTRTGTPEEAADLSEAAARLRPLRDSLTSLIDEDSTAYSSVLEATRLPKGTDADRTARRAALDAAMREAIDVPMNTMRCCQQALRGALVVAQGGNANALTDTAIGIELLLTGLRGAGMNVDVNIRSVSEADYADRVREERRELEAEGMEDARRARECLVPR
jgi:glutamate formiminotransferase/formiminotetrahydrofolate cyclodeaminase